MNILEEGVHKNTRRRRGMDATNMVFTNKMMDLVFCSGLCAVHSGIGEAHRRRKFVTTEGLSKDS